MISLQDKGKLTEAIAECEKILETKFNNGEIMTAGMFRYKRMLFLYLEYIVDDTAMFSQDEMENLPDEWLSPLAQYLEIWPDMYRNATWLYMYPVFWTDEPKSIESWKRKLPPDKRCGRIAVLYADKLFSYVCHHQALVQEGLLVGDRYQMISLHGNLLFSYFETPRDRERVNIKHENLPSEEIEKWEAVAPNTHFKRFEEAPNDNFMIIDTLISVG